MAFIQPQKYSYLELGTAAELAEEHFKRTREAEESQTADFYDRAYDEAYDRIEHVISSTNNLAEDELISMASQLFGEGYLETLRYMERPSLSDDDFKKMSGTNTNSRKGLSDQNTAQKAMRYLLRNINTKIIPWYGQNRKPTESDLLAAKRSVSALIADQKTKTMLRSTQSRKQEQHVRDALVRDAGFQIVPAHPFNTLREGPQPGILFDKETSIDGVKADIVFGLYDGRIMALECKVSNTAVNSYKRLNHETIDKVVKWRTKFGENGIVGGCVLQGVFAVDNLENAQNMGVSIFWSSHLESLTEYVLSTRQSGMSLR